MRSELLTLSRISHLTQHDGYLVQSTPTEPDFPDATQRSVVWDIPNLDPLRVHGVGDLGCKPDGFDTMVLQGSLRDATTPDGISVRALDGIGDWIKAEALQAEVGIEVRRDPVLHGPYLAWRNAGRRDQISQGIGQWFGAFDRDRIVAQIAMFHDESIARYQSVEMRVTHRRRGICSALLRHAAV